MNKKKFRNANPPMTIPINVIFIGVDSTLIDTNYILDNLNITKKITYNYENASVIEKLGGKYELDYKFYFSVD